MTSPIAITSFSGPGCFITPPVTMGNYGVAPDFEPTGTHLYPDYKFYCSGLIIGWNIRVLARGKITLSLWRKYENDAPESTNRSVVAYQRAGDVELLLEEGFNHINLAKDRQLEVTAGDIIGFQYRNIESNAAIAFDQWTCEFGFPCNSEDIFISNESPNSFMNSTTRLTAYKDEEAHSNFYYLSHFTVFSHTAFFPKIVPIVQEPGNSLSLLRIEVRTRIFSHWIPCIKRAIQIAHITVGLWGAAIQISVIYSTCIYGTVRLL